MIRTTTASTTGPHQPPNSSSRPFIGTSSIILTPYTTKGKPTVEVTAAHSSTSQGSSVAQDRSLRHQRTLRPSDFDRVDIPAPHTPTPSSIPIPRDEPSASASPTLKRPSPDRTAPGQPQTLSPTQRSSRALRREKTLMPEDFRNARNEATASSHSGVYATAPTDAPIRNADVRGFVTITLGPSADDKKRYNRAASDMRHYTVWQEFPEFDGSKRQPIATNEPTLDDFFNIQGVLVFSAFDDRSRNVEHPELVFNVTDVCIELRSYSRNSCSYAKERADAPTYVDVCDVSGDRRMEDTLIRIAFDPADKKWRAGGPTGRGHAAPVSCAFSLDIPMHLFRSAKERYFRITAQVALEVGPRLPLSYTAGGCRHATVQLSYAESDPVDFTVSHLALPRCEHSPTSPNSPSSPRPPWSST